MASWPIDSKGKRTVQLKQGAKGIIAMVKISSGFKRGDWIWDGDKYIGFFETEILEAKVVKLNTVNLALKQYGIQSKFVALVYGGIKPVDDAKAKIIKGLIK